MRRAWLTAIALAAACAPTDGTIEPPDLDWNRMLEQPRYDSYAYSPWFDDRAAMRHPPEGTVPFAGEEGAVPAIPTVPTRRLLERGQRKWAQTCAACHGLDASGDTPVSARMSLRPAPSLHTDKARGFTNEVLLEIVRDGYGLMPSYAQHLEPRDRVAVVFYLRALQLSQHAELAALPPAIRREAEEALR